MAEWSKAHAWKVCRRATVSWVRIPPSPPDLRATGSEVLEASLSAPFFCGNVVAGGTMPLS